MRSPPLTQNLEIIGAIRRQAERNVPCFSVAPMRLDLLMPTFQRPELLRATRPRAMKVSVTVINNASEPLEPDPAV